LTTIRPGEAAAHGAGRNRARRQRGDAPDRPTGEEVGRLLGLEREQPHGKLAREG
jgi:hypothetical protein